jgi:hypothetical protein
VDVRSLTEHAIAEATGRAHRDDEALPGAGGPAGNARLTSWVGLVLLVLFGVELVTLLDVRGLMSWHVAVGIALIPPALLKTGTTGWRIVRYYTALLGRSTRSLAATSAYRRAGPPPMLLRVLGPFVVLTTLGVLATGVLLIAIGAPASQRPLLTVGGHTLDATSLHKSTFVLWLGVTGLHVLARLVPALQMTILRRLPSTRVPGQLRRGGIVTVTLLVAATAAVVTLGAVDVSGWHHRAYDGPARVVRR